MFNMDLIIDPAIIIAFVALIISISTLWLTELRGPDISLVNHPEFTINDTSIGYPYTEHTSSPKWFRLEPVSFLFANYGGKDGTILDLKVDFAPNNLFKKFLNSFVANSPQFQSQVEKSSLPITIKEGSNRYLQFSPEILTIDWKEDALAEVLDHKLKVEEIVERALEKSKENFRTFCDFLENHKELGKVKCIVTLTKGRFRTTIQNQLLPQNFVVASECDKSLSSLRECLLKWEDIHATRIQMESMLVQDARDIMRELRENRSILATPITEQYISTAIKLKADTWQRLQNIKNTNEKKIRWFILKMEKGLEEELVQLYESIRKYNNSCDNLMSLGELRTSKNFESINIERENVLNVIHMILIRIDNLQRKFIKSQ